MSDDPYRPPESKLGNTGNRTLYSIPGVITATILGSLAAGIFLIYLNYRSLGYTRLAGRTMAWGSGSYLMIIGVVSFVPQSPAFGALFIAIQTGLAGFAAHQLQGVAIDYHRQHGGPIHSPLRAAGVGIVTGMVVLFALVFLLTVGSILLPMSGVTPGP